MNGNGWYKEQHLLGQAGVFRVAAELMFRGLHVLIPAVDVGVDLYIEGGTRIQVKTSRFVYPNGKVQFRLSTGYNTTSTGRVKLGARIFSDYCDFVVLFNATLNRFWIVPAELLNGMKSCSAGGGKVTLLSSSDRDTILSRRENGETWASIADSYGVSMGSIRQIVGSPCYGQRSTRLRRSVSEIINQHEDNWVLIESHAKIMSGVSDPQDISQEVCYRK